MKERILLIRTSALGDVLLALPAARALKAARPDAQVALLTDARFFPLCAGSVDELISWRAGVLGEVRARRFDVVVDLQRKAKTVALSLASGARRRLALEKRTWGGVARAALGRDAPSTRAHAVALYCEALRPLGVSVPSQRSAAPRSERLVALAPGAAHATKRWPPERFAEVGDALSAAGWAVALVGGPGDAQALEAVASRLARRPAVDARGLDLPSLAALLARCALLVTNDSGPAHLAAELGTPVVAVFGPTSPARWTPFSTAVRPVSLALACSPCTNHGGARCPLGHHACLRELPASRALAAARELLP